MYKSVKHQFINIVNNHIFKYPSPSNLSYLWNLGFISLMCLIVQILTGIFLAMHYCSDVTLAFSSIEHIMRDINSGWLLRYAHANGASFFFIAVYIHIARNLYFQRYTYSNLMVWNSGILIFFLMMAAAFIGYVLPWGQMSFWGATVITNLVSAVPLIGSRIVFWLWGGFSVSAPTLSRFFSLHYIVPFIILFLAVLHMSFLHDKGSSNPSQLSSRINRSYLPLYPYYVVKDFLGFIAFLLVLVIYVMFYPDMLGHSDNYIEANPLLTPAHIVPEWYFLPFYAILRSIPNKLAGVVFMVVAILIFLTLPFLSYICEKQKNRFYQSYIFNNIVHPFFTVFFFNIFLLLGWLGSQPVEDPYIMLGALLVLLYFVSVILFFFLLPMLFVKVKKNKHTLNSISGVINFTLFNNQAEIVLDKSFFFWFMVFSIFLIFILLILSMFMSNTALKTIDSDKVKPFECGFEPYNINPSFKINIHYFRIALIFLIFDLEILFLLPWCINLKYFLLEGHFYYYFLGIPFLFLIFIGLVYEYLNRLTDWRFISF